MTECREYHGHRHSQGYGRPTLGAVDGERGRVYLHRWVMEMALGRRLRSSEVVRHTCDNPSCFLLEHLRLGTQAENNADKRSKGRHSRGEAHGRAKLTREDVAFIRASLLSEGQLARLYRVHHSTVRAARVGRTWQD